MASLDAFSAEIVRLVRGMSDDALLALVKNQLGFVRSGAPSTSSGSVSKRVSKRVSKKVSKKVSRKVSRKPSTKAAAPVAKSRPAKKSNKVKPAAPKPAVPAAAPSMASASKPAPAKKAVAKKAAKAAKAASPKAAAKAVKAPSAKSAGKKAKAGKSGSRSTGAGKLELMAAVERVVRSSNGLSASEIAKASGTPQGRASAALKELKAAKRIFQGGDRRFARYAGDPRSAEAASLQARKTASGPIVKGKKRR